MSGHTRWIRITECGNIPLREGRAVNVGGREIAIFNLGGRFLAIENRCPHKGGPLSDGIVSGTTVVCPLHTSRVDLETGAAVHPDSARSCLTTYPTRVDGGVVLLEVPSVMRDAACRSLGEDGAGSWIEATPIASD